jgi:hypothetical protein
MLIVSSNAMIQDGICTWPPFLQALLDTSGIILSEYRPSPCGPGSSKLESNKKLEFTGAKACLSELALAQWGCRSWWHFWVQKFDYDKESTIEESELKECFFTQGWCRAWHTSPQSSSWHQADSCRCSWSHEGVHICHTPKSNEIKLQEAPNYSYMKSYL